MAEKFPYEDIVNLPPHISKKHPQPTMMERAARFAPFAAITGYEEMVLEEAREKRRQKAVLDIKTRFGPNAILKGISYQEGATAKERNESIGGHKA